MQILKCVSNDFCKSLSPTEMAEGNGEVIEEMATATKTDGSAESERTPDYIKLVEYGLDKRVIEFN